MTENTHANTFLLLAFLIDLAYLLQSQLQEPTRLKLLCDGGGGGGDDGVYRCMQMFFFHTLTAFVKIRSAKAKQKSKPQGPCQHIRVKLLCACMWGMCVHRVSRPILISKHISVGPNSPLTE